MTTGGSDAELITRVRAGDRSAFGTLYARHSQAATNLARQFARSPAEVDDLVSESFARVLDALLGGRGPATAFRAYLFTTLRNTAFDRTRKDSKLQFTDDVAVHETPEVPDDPVVLELENTLVAKAFASLPERWQVVLWHTQVDRQSPAEVGVLLGMSANAVTSLAFRAREGLREAYLRAHLADTAAERCRTTVDRLGAWVRGGLSKREQAQVDAHLDECDRCRALAAELTEINSGLRAILAPLLLGGAAAGYLATTSTGVAVPLVAAGAAGGGAAVGAGAAAGSGSSGGLWSFLARPWTLAAGGAGVAAAAAVAIVIAVTGNPAPAAAPPPPVTAVAPTSVTSTPQTTPASPSATHPSTSPASSSPAPVVPPATPTPAIRVTPSTTSAPPPTTREPAPAVVHTTVGTSPYSRQSTPASSAPPTSSAPTSSPNASATSTTLTTAAPAPAKLSAPQFDSTSLSATAGAPGTVRFSVTNSGATDSDPQHVQISTPPGVSLAGGSGAATSQAPALRGFSALLPAPGAAGAGSVTCVRASCTYRVPASSVLTVTLRLTISPAAEPGPLTLTVGTTRVSLPVKVQPGLTELRFVDPSGAWQAGTTLTTTLEGTVAKGVTDVGTVTLPLHNGDLWITGYPSNCAASGAMAIACTAVSVTKRVADFGSLSVTLLPTAGGKQKVATTLPGNRSLPVVGAGGAAITATPLEPGGSIDMTGPFGGTVIGAATMYCGGTTRSPCQGTDHPCQSQTNPKCSEHMAPFDPPIARTLPIPDRARLVSAQLTWAMSTQDDPGQAVPDDAGSVNLVIDGQQCTPRDDGRGCVTGQRLTAPEPIGASIQCSSLSPCPDTEVAQWVADVTDLVKGHHTFAVVDLDAPDRGTSRTPMGAWALTLIWSISGPTAPMSTISARTPVQAIAGQGGQWSCTSTSASCPATSGSVQSAAVVLWGVDNLPDKSIAIGTGPDSVIASYRAPGDPRGPELAGVMTNAAGTGWLATGLDIVTESPNRQLSGALTVTSTGTDLIWVGATLVVRNAT